MPVAIEMKGKLEPVVLDQAYLDTINSLNTAAAAGKKFILADAEDGKHVAISIEQILTITEQEVDTFAGIS